MTLTSIVIPVYNTSRYLSNCIDSITNYNKNYEIICVDDGSSDDSVEILEKYQYDNDRIHVIKHQKNMGLLQTRKDGVMSSHGDYIMFLDSDDSFEPHAVDELSELMDDSDADMIHFGTNVIKNEGADDELVAHYKDFLKPRTGAKKGKDVFISQFTGFNDWHVWTKIYKKELCQKAYSQTSDRYMILSDDLYISFYLSYYAKKMITVKKQYYRYNIGRGFTKSSNDAVLQIHKISENSWFIDDCIEFIRKENTFDDYYRYCLREPLLQLGACLSLLDSLNDSKMKEEELSFIEEKWNFDYCKNIIENYKSNHKASQIKRLFDYLKLFGLGNTMKVISLSLR